MKTDGMKFFVILVKNVLTLKKFFARIIFALNERESAKRIWRGIEVVITRRS